MGNQWAHGASTTNYPKLHKSLNIKNSAYQIIKEPTKPWIFFGEIQGTSPELGTILVYGHLDKQPHFPNWVEGVDNTKPGIIDGKLYGRGGADDGYALPSAALLIKILQDFGLPHGRIILIGENEEESGSPNLEYFLRKLQGKIGNPEIIICLDSGALDYSHFLIAVGLKGLINFNLTVKVL